MPLKQPVLRWMTAGGFVIGFMAMLKWTGNLNRAFFVDWFKKIPKDVHQSAGGGIAETSPLVKKPIH